MRTHKHPRLRGYDHSQAGAYFVTICTHERAHLYGQVMDPVELTAEPFMDLNDAGKVVQRCWDATPGHYPHVLLDAFQVMPNHVHGIILITDPIPIVASRHAATDPIADLDGSGHAPTLHNGIAAAGKRRLANIVGSFKSAVSKGVNELRGMRGAPVWQKGYHDRVIRDDAEHDRIAQYIAENPANWWADPNYIQPDNNA